MLKRILFLLILFYSKLIIAADDYVLERAYFEDKTGLMTFAEAKEQTYQKLEGILSKGYSKSTFWLRLKISEADQRPKDKLILRIQPTYLDYIRLYDPEDLTEKVRVVGDKNINTTNDYESLNFNFFIPKKNYARYIYLQLKTTSTSFINVQALDLSDYIHQDKIQELIFSFYIGILFLLFLFPLILWVNSREFLWGIFTIKQFGAISIVAFHSGALKLLLKNILPTSLDFAFNINLLIYSFITVFFHYMFLSEFKIKPWAKIYFIGIMICFPIELFLLLNGNILEALNLNMHVLNTLAFMFLLIPWLGLSLKDIDQQIFSRQWLIAIHVLMFIFAVITTLPSLGYFQGNAFSPMAGMTYGGITGIIFLFVLQYRYRVSRDKVVSELSSATAYASSEKKRREEQGKFLTMLTHELKTPLSILKMSYSSAQSSEKTKGYIQTAINDMTDVIDRCAMAGKFESERLKLDIQVCDLNKILGDKLAQYQCDDRFDLLEKTNIKLETDVQLLRIILDNLIGNALKYGKESEKITLVLSRKTLDKKPYALITISNEAGSAGVPDANKVFEKYYRAPRAYEQTGSGLGLYLVTNFVELIGGSLQFSAKGHVVTFQVKLPLQGTSENENS